jgi:uncharacterized protein
VHKTEGQRFLPPTRAQLLADLRWLLLSPPLLCDSLFPGQIQSFSSDERESIERWLQQLATRESPLCATDFEMQTYQRLGRYAEKLLRFFLLNFSNANHAPDAIDGGRPYQLLAHNLAINSNVSGASTQGEVDFLLKDSQGRPWHWELAVKFFVCEPAAVRLARDQVEAFEIIGPNRKDRLSLKIAKLFGRQLRHIIPAPFESTAWQPQAFAKGRIYYYLDEAPPEHSQHLGKPLLHPEHERGFWCLANEVDQLAAKFPGATLYPLNRSEWLSPKNAATIVQDRVHLPLGAKPDASTLPLMVAVMRDNTELGRGFILPEDHLRKPMMV